MAVNVALVAAAATETDAGTLRAEGVLLDNATLTPPVAAALDSVTVHIVVEDAASVVPAHCSEDTVTGATRERPAVTVTPFSAALTVAV